MACDRKPANNAAVSVAAALTGRSRAHVVDLFHAAASTSRDQREADPDDVAAALFRLRGAVTASDLPDHDKTRLARLAADATQAPPGPTRAQLAAWDAVLPPGAGPGATTAPVPSASPAVVRLPDLAPDHHAAWTALLDLHDARPAGWCIVGGQMVALNGWEHGQQPPRATTDADLVVDIRSRPDALYDITRALERLHFKQDGVSPDGVGHRWKRRTGDGPTASIDILIPEGSGQRVTRRMTTGARTIEAAGTTQALHRARLVPVELAGRTGGVSCPPLLGSLVAKAAAHGADHHKERHRTDVAFLAGLVTDPRPLLAQTTRKDRQRLTAVLAAMPDGHPCWRGTPDPTAARAVLVLLAAAPTATA